MPKPKILVFIDWFVPAYKAGGPITSCYNAIEALKGYFDFYVVTSNTDYLENEPLKGIESDCWNSNDGFKVFYTSKTKLSIGFIRETIKHTEHQVLWINGFFSFYFSILPSFFRIKSKRTIISTRGMLGGNVLQFKSLKKRIFIQLSKILNLYKGVLFHATNQSEAIEIENNFNNKVLIASNFPTIKKSNQEKVRQKNKGELKILQVARIAKEKNTLFTIDLITKMRGNVVLDIVGSIYDKEYADDCKELANHVKSNIKINFLGPKSPIELNSLMGNYDLFLLPTLGENFGHSIAESLSNGIPVLISNKTPWRNLEESNAGFDLPLKKELFLEKLNFFQMLNQKEMEIWKNGASSFFLKEVNIEKIMKQNLKLFSIE